MIKNNNEEADPSVRIYKEKKPLECQLTDPELKILSKELADEFYMRSLAEHRLEKVRAEIKGEIAAHNEKIERCITLIKSEKETRPVEVKITLDFKTGMKTILRLDTGEIIREQKLTDDERQLELRIAGEGQ